MSEPRIKPTNAATLVVAGFAAAALTWVSTSYWYWELADLPLLPVAITLGVLALLEFVLAQQTRARIERKPGRLPVEPLLVARYVALAKATSLTGAIFSGFALALTLWLAVEAQSNDAARRDLPIAVITSLAALAAMGAGLWLERACRVPKDPDQKDADQR
ncbi:DUF3180 domain-containing protein [Catelliglobosispora koreensis]|uniref:DUF3180 domain-containing protein n=1 Tax=Catelliglobosispora koreensis TaxID=129052 RepID=UPI0003709D6A|nr:DUF3180 domain-containing protein [Catelliglobosispora koreensis]